MGSSIGEAEGDDGSCIYRDVQALAEWKSDSMVDTAMSELMRKQRRKGTRHFRSPKTSRTFWKAMHEQTNDAKSGEADGLV